MAELDERIFFQGIDTDTEDRSIENGSYRYALNIDIADINAANVGRVVNTFGNTLVSITLPAGSNRVIGTFEFIDENAVIYHVFNVFGNHGIYRYDFSNNTIRLLYSDPLLKYTSGKLITHCNIIGDLLYWTDGNVPPRKINMKKADELAKHRIYNVYSFLSSGVTYTFEFSLNGAVVQNTVLTPATGLDQFGLTQFFKSNLAFPGATITSFNSYLQIKFPVGIYTLNVISTDIVRAIADNFYPSPRKEDFIDRLKYPFRHEPVAAYKQDLFRSINLVEGRVFQFFTRFIYDDFEKSTWSPVSRIPAAAPSCAAAQNTFNYIEIDFSDTRLNDNSVLSIIRGVEIGFREHNTGAYQSIVLLNPDEFGDNKYKFYNDGIYRSIAIDEQNKLFDSMGITVGASEIISNRVFDADIVEGYDQVNTDVDLSVDYNSGANIKTFDISGRVLIQCETSIYSTIAIHNPHGSFTNNDGIVFGGIKNTELPAGSPGAVPGLVANIGANFKQTLPCGGFILYLAATSYYGISKQKQTVGAPNQDVNGIYDTTTWTNRQIVRAVMAGGQAYSQFSIKNVPPGKYILRVAGNYLNQSDIDIATLNFQRSSTYTTQVGGVVDTECVIIVNANGTITIPATGITTGQGVDIGDTIIQDLTQADQTAAHENCGVYGYVSDHDDAGGTADEVLNDTRIEKSVAIVSYTAASVPSPFILSAVCDHNGFFFSHFRDLLITNGHVSQIIVNGVVANIGGTSYNYADLLTGALVAVPNSVTNTATLALYRNTNNTISDDCRTTFHGSILANGSLVSGVGVVITHGGQSKSSGGTSGDNFQLYVYAIAGSRNDDLYFESDGLGCIYDFSPNPFHVSIFIDSSGAAGHYNNTILPPPIPVTASLNLIDTVLSAFKRGFSGQFGIVYYDRGNRSTTVNTNKKMVLTIPFYTEPLNTGGTLFPTGAPNVSWAIKNLPPDWATHYQFVRTKDRALLSWLQISAAKVIYTDDITGTPTGSTYQNAQFIAISIDNLVQYKKEHPSSLLAYTWQAGDRIRFIQDANGNYFTGYYDFEVVAYVAPYIFLEKDFILPQIANGAFFEIYRLNASVSEKIYFEFGETFDIGTSAGRKYHKGLSQDQNPLSPITTPAKGAFRSGDAWYRTRVMPYLNGAGNYINKVHSVDDGSISDFYSSLDQSIGRVNVYDKDLGQIHREKAVRFSDVYVQDTKINGLSSNNALNDTEILKGEGRIYKLQRAGNVLLAIQRKQCNSLYINQIVYIDANGNPSLTVSDKVIGTIRPLEGQYGTIFPESVKQYEGRVYFFDVFSATPVRYAQDGLTPIAYKTQSYFLDVSQRLLANPLVNVFGGFDPGYNRYYLGFRFANRTNIFTGETFSFDEDKNRWASWHSFLPEWLSFAGLNLITFTDGKLWTHDNPVRNNFYGVQYVSKVRVISNENSGKIRNFIGIGVEGSDVWWCPDDGSISIPPSAAYPQGMASRLLKSIFKRVYTVWYAAFKKDLNTPNITPAQAIVNGRNLAGHTISVELTNDNTEETTLHAVNIRYTLNELSKK